VAADPVQLLKEAYAAFNSGDIPAVVAVMNPAIEWHEPGLRGYPPPGGDRVYLGPQSVVKSVFAALARCMGRLRHRAGGISGQRLKESLSSDVVPPSPGTVAAT